MKIFSYLLIFKLAFVIAIGHAAPVSNASSKEDSWSQDATESNIARLIPILLERLHYSQDKFDDEISGKFLDRYFEVLDGQHLHFLQSDLAEFETYRTKLDDLTAKAGDTKPAHLIFARMMERVQQRVAYVNELLKTEKFDFTGNDRYTPSRKDLPRPKNLAEARELWRQHLRFEYLQEKLSAPDTNKVHASKSKEGQLKSEEKDGQKSVSLNGINAPKLSVEKLTGDTNKTFEIISTNIPLTQKEVLVKKITKRYVNLERTLNDLTGDEVFEIYMTALARVYDPHSDYMGRSQFENFNISMRLSLFGIGAVLQSEDGYCKIKELMDGPAKKSNKINPGDRIVAVGQGDKEPVDVVDMKLNKVVELIRGPKGTEVRLAIWPGDAADPTVRKYVTLIRDVIKLEDQEAKAKVIEVPNKKETVRLGVIDLPSFYGGDMGPAKGSEPKEPKSTTADVAKLLKKLNQEKVSGLILDLRRNGGGLLDEAINLTGLFITNGPVVQVKNHEGEIITKFDSDSSIAYKGPLIVLISHFSASASEILAGALQDYGRAIIVGDSSSFGKGTVQQVLSLDALLEQNRLTYTYNPGVLKPTTAVFYRAGGASTQLRGVIPDLKLPTVLDYAEIGEASMENPLPWDEVSSATFQKWNLVKSYLPELQKRSDRRIESDKEYGYIREDIEIYKKSLTDKSLSLNEQERRKEKKESDARDEVRKKERKARKETKPKIFEVTLKNATEPGLQLYVPKTNEVAATTSDFPKGDADDQSVEDKIPVVDAALEESKQILMDYISLLPAADRALSKVN